MKIVSKLRKKFVLIASLSVFVLLAAILTAVNLANFLTVASNADRITLTIAESGGRLNEQQVGDETISYEATVDPNVPGPGGDEPRGPDSKETLASIRYFTYSFDASGNGTQVALNMSLVNNEEALSWSKELLSAGEIGWSRTYYRFRKYELNSSTYVTLIDESRELEPSYTVLWGSLIGSSIGMAVAIVAIVFISKWVFKPLEESQRKQKRFISNASHELKTPLAIVSANAEILEIEHGEDESTSTIKKQVKRMNEMVKNLNALTKIDEIERLETSSFSLSNAAIEIANSFDKAFKNKNIDYRVNIKENVNFKGDESLLRETISVILDNALKYSISKTEFSLKENNGRIVLEENNDADLPDGPLDMIFERFYRADSSRASVEGSGIGLSIAKEAVDIHKGRISAYAKDGVFHIKIEL